MMKSLTDISRHDVPMQSILDARGYLVMSTSETFQPGDVVEVNNKEFSLVVLAKTTRADFVEQGRMWGHAAYLDPVKEPNYYRVTAE